MQCDTYLLYRVTYIYAVRHISTIQRDIYLYSETHIYYTEGHISIQCDTYSCIQCDTYLYCVIHIYSYTRFHQWIDKGRNKFYPFIPTENSSSLVHPEDDIMTLSPRLPPMPPHPVANSTTSLSPVKPEPTMVTDSTNSYTPGHGHIVGECCQL